MSFYTIRRDDSELRIVICPKCSTPDHGITNVTDLGEYIPYETEHLLKLMQCNQCNAYFTFHREDGLSEISEEVAQKALEDGHCDMREDGRDCHGHSFYVIFKNKPPTLSREEYDELMGYKQDNRGNYCDEDPKFKKWLKAIPSINKLVHYRDMINNIDFESMGYLEKKTLGWFR